MDQRLDTELLLGWYAKNRRLLPWRTSKDPYSVWISEVMLQQTTVTAVIPYYERFLTRFPTVGALASAPIESVLEAWAGLGYYSRARSLHAASKLIAETGFPKTFEGLLNLPGFGPYTSRAVSSICFGERVGALDGNLIRVLARRFGVKDPWWKTDVRRRLQAHADGLAQHSRPGDVNQALMDIGGLVCTPTSPRCTMCPLVSRCVSAHDGLTEKIPLAKPRKRSEIWIWQPEIIEHQDTLALSRNDYAPFLKGQWMWPGTARKSKTPPKRYAFTHAVTHHKIYVLEPKKKYTRNPKALERNLGELTWSEPGDVQRINPASLVTKVLELL